MKQTCVLVFVLLAACGPGGRGNGNGDDGDDGGDPCPRCSDDKTAVISCDGEAKACAPDQLCSNGECMNGCAAAENNHASVGCEYYAVDMDAADGPPRDACFTVFVANTSRGQAHIDVDWGGQFIDLSKYAKLPQGTGTSLTYAPYDPSTGLAPGQVAILFLAYAPAGSPLMGNVTCPVPA